MTEGHRKSSLFREVNERVRDVSAQWDSTQSVGFFCECSDTGCSELLDLTVADYEAIRAMRDCFVVVRGHESSRDDHVVERRDSLSIVQPAATAANAPAG